MKALNLRYRALTNACSRNNKPLRALLAADAVRYGEEIIHEKVQ